MRFFFPREQPSLDIMQSVSWCLLTALQMELREKSVSGNGIFLWQTLLSYYLKKYGRIWEFWAREAIEYCN